MTLYRSLLDMLISILIDLLTGLVGSLIQLQGPQLRLADGRKMPPQFLVAIQDYLNAKSAMTYWNGVMAHV